VVSEVFIAEVLDGLRDKRSGNTTMVDVETLMETFVKDFWTCEYFCQMLQCQDFWSISFQIKGILLYLLYTVNFIEY
jgi:hypothetical protein